MRYDFLSLDNYFLSFGEDCCLRLQGNPTTTTLFLEYTAGATSSSEAFITNYRSLWRQIPVFVTNCCCRHIKSKGILEHLNGNKKEMYTNAVGIFLGKNPLAKTIVLIDSNCDCSGSCSASSDGHASH